MKSNAITVKTGRVFITGAGPGNPGLITEKAKSALNKCDAVVYDHLVSLELIVPLQKRVERIYAGKSATRHTMKQEEINRLLVKLAQEGKTVVRLKGGDPYIFGRGGEEALHLRENGIPFEIIPGVTAGVAVPAYAGIPVTHRGKSAFAVFITAHEAAEKQGSEIPWDLLAGSQKGTIVGYMGVKTLPDTVFRLLKGGMHPDTPTAVIERGTTGRQVTVTGTLENIAGKVKEAGVKPPALVIIGETAALQHSIGEAEDLPLKGKTIMITRPGDQAQEMYRDLRELGAEILPLPSIATEASADFKGWEKFWDIIGGWLLFTSENGVRYFFEQYFTAGFDLRSLSKFQIAAVGSGTEKALSKIGIIADFLPRKFTVRDLAEEMTMQFDFAGVDVVRVRGNLADDTAERILRGAGAKVLPLAVYRTYTPAWDAGMFTAFREAEIDAVTFTSGSTVKRLKEILGEEEFAGFMEKTPTISIGPMTSQTIEELGGTVAAEAKVYSIEGVTEALVGCLTN